jgi:two-component system sensor histidine kinase HydH
LDEGIAICHEVLMLPREGREPRKMEVSALPVGAGNALLLVVSLNDRGTAEHVMRRVEQMDRLASVGTMSAGVCHEIKNAMVPVKTLVDLLLKNNQDAEMAGLVSRELRRIDSLVSQMLRFAGPARPVSAAFHLHEVLDHTLKLVEGQAAGRKVAITRKFSAAIDRVRGDHYQMQQAFLNLFLNALEAMPTGGNLSIGTAFTDAPGLISPQTPSMLVVTVRDTGRGIAPENLARLFEPFFTTKTEGNGLGLAITQRIIREHGGEITVDSVLGQGTVFTISLSGANAGH